jgi:hypothetical protein
VELSKTLGGAKKIAHESAFAWSNFDDIDARWFFQLLPSGHTPVSRDFGTFFLESKVRKRWAKGKPTKENCADLQRTKLRSARQILDSVQEK